MIIYPLRLVEYEKNVGQNGLAGEGNKAVGNTKVYQQSSHRIPLIDFYYLIIQSIYLLMAITG